MSDRAPDGQPTSNIAQCLDHERKQLDYWERAKDLETRALATSTRMVEQTREQVEKWETRLQTRLGEEAAAAQEVTGL